MDVASPMLGPSARQLIISAAAESGVLVSAISFWECAMLCDRQRLRLSRPPESWREEILSSGVREVATDGAMAIAAAQLGLEHTDPADRFIIATALA